MQIEMYMLIAERLRDARRRGDDVDHYVDELAGLWATMSKQERERTRERLLG